MLPVPLCKKLTDSNTSIMTKETLAQVIIFFFTTITFRHSFPT